MVWYLYGQRSMAEDGAMWPSLPGYQTIVNFRTRGEEGQVEKSTSGGGAKNEFPIEDSGLRLLRRGPTACTGSGGPESRLLTLLLLEVV